MMESEDGSRLARAWAACREWITEFDGSVTQAELLGVGITESGAGISALEEIASHLRVLPIWRDEEKNPPVGLPVDGLIERLAEGDVLSLTVNYDIFPDQSPVEMHLSMFMDAPTRVAISASWWPDQAFPEGEDESGRFADLFAHLVDLQSLFHADQLYIGPEAADRPGDPGSLWVEV